MKTIKNQQMFHIVDFSGKKTRCGLSNQYKDAQSEENFKEYINNPYYSDICCEKCRKSLK